MALFACQTCWGDCIAGDCYSGFGMITLANGDKYLGDWKNGRKHGWGTYTYSNGQKYVGDWEKDKRHGEGTHTFPSGNEYIGDWKDSTMHGQGTLAWANGNKYVGHWKNNTMHGQGTFTWADGSTTTGIWEMDTYLGTKAELEAKERARKAKEQKEKVARKETKIIYDRIYNACLLDKSSDVDMQVNALKIAVQETCGAIATDPSWFEELKYN